jgi:hypothetical protein
VIARSSFCLVTVLVLTFSLCCSAKGKKAMTAKEPTELETLGRDLGLSFPEGTTVVGIERQEGMDDMLRAKLQMSAEAARRFLEHAPVRSDAFRPGVRGLLGADKDWWDPHQAKRLRSGQANLDGARVLNIGVDEARPDAVVVYIVNHGT